MARDKAYQEAEKRIEQARRSVATELSLRGIGLCELPESLGHLGWLRSLILSNNQLTALPTSLGQLTVLESLSLSDNRLVDLPPALGQLKWLHTLNLSNNLLTTLPELLSNLANLRWLNFSDNKLTTLPETLGTLVPRLRFLDLSGNKLNDLPDSAAQLWQLESLNLTGNSLNPELAAAYRQGLDVLRAYLRARASSSVSLNEAKLILVGEGAVGKSCLMDALRGVPWQEHDTTHGIKIDQIHVTVPESKREITLNGWDFGGQRVYRPTHQLFFSAPAVYLVVWKPREGPQQDLVKEWIRLIKHREPDAKILVVATHGGPQQRQPDIDRQELWDLFGKETVIDFFFVDNKPDGYGNRRGIENLRQAIARIAANLPEIGRHVPKRWQEVRESLQKNGETYLPLNSVLEFCHNHQMDNAETRVFIAIEHRLGHLIYYENDPVLQNIIILKPDWLATAMSFVLDDEETRKNHGLVSFNRLRQLWDDSNRADEVRYAQELHPLFLRLMERFDLSYKVSLPAEPSDAIGFWEQIKSIATQIVKTPNELEKFRYTSLIAQLVPDKRPDPINSWVGYPLDGNIEQMQICRIVDDRGQSATAEGLFYQLIVRLHKYSLGRVNYYDSVHWQRGLVLDDDYNGRALLEYKGNDVHITVRAPYPERFLAMLTSEVKYLVENFWQGLRCQVMVPCVNPCGRKEPGTGLYEVEKLIDSKRKNRPEFPCPVCNEWQDIDSLLRNAPAATRPISLDELLAQFATIKDKLDSLDANTRRILSQVDKNYYDLLSVLTDEAKEGPRLFSIVPVDRRSFNPKDWVRAKFRLALWCEHSRLPLSSPSLNGLDSKKGIYEIELDRAWFKKAAPFLKLMTGTLSVVLPVASSAIKLALNDADYTAIAEDLDFGKSVIDASIGEGNKVGDWVGAGDKTLLEPDKVAEEFGEPMRAQGAVLRELHVLLKAKDPGFGGLVRVLNKRNEFLWVHQKFAGEY